MGYYTRVTEEIVIVPPIPWEDIKDSPFLPDNAGRSNDYRDVKFRIVEEAVDTPEGRLYKRSAAAVEPAWEDSFKAYYIVEHLQELVDAYPNHQFTGFLYGEGEENDDIWRLLVNKDRRAVQIKPRMVWPDDEPGQ